MLEAQLNRHLTNEQRIVAENKILKSDCKELEMKLCSNQSEHRLMSDQFRKLDVIVGKVDTILLRTKPSYASLLSADTNSPSQSWECRKDEVVLCRTRIGHTHLTHSYILKYPPPRCEHCQCILTVRHILVECNHLAQTRNDIFGRCVVESFKFHPELILIFLGDSEFYSKL